MAEKSKNQVSFEESARVSVSGVNPEKAPSDDKLNEFSSARLYKMIDYAKDRYHWYEDQREKKLSLALAMLALSGATLTIVINSSWGRGFQTHSFQYFCAIALLASLILTSTLTLFIYLRGQNQRYSHRENIRGNIKLNSIYSWYGYGVPKSEQQSLMSYIVRGSRLNLIIRKKDDARAEKVEDLSVGFARFCEVTVPRLVSRDKAALEDLQQVYILQIFQVIARDNLQKMIKMLQYGGLMIGIIVFVLIVSLFFVQNPTGYDPGEAKVNIEGSVIVPDSQLLPPAP